MNIDWKLWLVIGGLSIGLLAQLGDLLVCHWLPTASGRSVCGAITAEASVFGAAAKGIGLAEGGSTDGGVSLPLALP